MLYFLTWLHSGYYFFSSTLVLFHLLIFGLFIHSICYMLCNWPFFHVFYSIHLSGDVKRGTRPAISVNKIRATIRVWAWFTSDGAGSIVLLDNLSEEQFLELLDEVFVPYITARFGTGPFDFMDASVSRNRIPHLCLTPSNRWNIHLRCLSGLRNPATFPRLRKCGPTSWEPFVCNEDSPQMPQSYGTTWNIYGSEGVSSRCSGKV